MTRLLSPACVVGLALLAAPVRPMAGDVVPWQGLFISVAGPRWIDRAAQVQAESGFDPAAVSPVGAKGAVQAMDPTWREWQGRGWVRPGASPFDAYAAIPGQHRYMIWLEARVGGQLDPALAGYNWGIGRILQVQRHVAALGAPGSMAWRRFLPAETQGYLVHNTQNRARIRAELARFT